MIQVLRLACLQPASMYTKCVAGLKSYQSVNFTQFQDIELSIKRCAMPDLRWLPVPETIRSPIPDRLQVSETYQGFTLFPQNQHPIGLPKGIKGLTSCVHAYAPKARTSLPVSSLDKEHNYGSSTAHADASYN